MTRGQTGKGILTTTEPRPLAMAAGVGHSRCRLNKLSFTAGLVLWWGLSNASAQTWIQLQPAGQAPTANSNMNAVYDSTGNNMIVFGGGFTPRNNVTSVLSNANGFGGTSAWTQLAPSGQLPPIRSFHSVVYDATDNEIVIYGGFTGSGDNQPLLNDVWVLRNANGQGGTPAWTQLFPGGGPPTQRAVHTAVYDPSSDRMIVFGGCTGGSSSSCSTPLNDVWVLTNASGLGGTSPEWVQLEPSGPLPPARSSHTAVFDSASTV